MYQYKSHSVFPIKIEYMKDAIGLNKAYLQGDRNYIFGDTLYIAGTSSCYDVLIDLTIPLHCLIYTPRYQQSERIIINNTNIKRIVGHSLGAAITHNLIRDYSNIEEGIAIGSPTILTNSYGGRLRYFRHCGDPVSICNLPSDNLEEDMVYTLNPHTYNLYNNCLGRATKKIYKYT